MDKVVYLTFRSNDAQFEAEHKGQTKCLILHPDTDSRSVLYVHDWGSVEYANTEFCIRMKFNTNECSFARRIENTWEWLDISTLNPEEHGRLRVDLDIMEQRVFEHILCAQMLSAIHAITILKYRFNLGGLL